MTFVKKTFYVHKQLKIQGSLINVKFRNLMFAAICPKYAKIKVR